MARRANDASLTAPASSPDHAKLKRYFAEAQALTFVARADRAGPACLNTRWAETSGSPAG